MGSAEIALNGTITAPKVTATAGALTINGTITADHGIVQLASQTSTTIGATAVIRAVGSALPSTIEGGSFYLPGGTITLGLGNGTDGGIKIKSQTWSLETGATLTGSLISIELPNIGVQPFTPTPCGCYKPVNPFGGLSGIGNLGINPSDTRLEVPVLNIPIAFGGLLPW